MKNNILRFISKFINIHQHETKRNDGFIACSCVVSFYQSGEA